MALAIQQGIRLVRWSRELVKAHEALDALAQVEEVA
jgi:hypothetical protein